MNTSLACSCIRPRDVLRGRPAIDPQRLFEAAVRREAPFAGLHVLVAVERARWALDYALARLAAGGPLSTRLDFVPPPEPIPLKAHEVLGRDAEGYYLVSSDTWKRLRGEGH